MATKKPDIRLKRLPSYIKYVRENTYSTGIIEPGYFYTYNYRFDLAPNFRSQDFDVIRFYDYFPLAFVFDKYRSKSGYTIFRGLNFHHLPVRARRLWLTRLRKAIPGCTDVTESIDAMSDYTPLFYLFRKATFGVRQYRLDRVRNLNLVPNQTLDRIMSFASRTYFNATLAEVAAAYSNYVPGMSITELLSIQ